jgi:hypothetical protein
MSLERILISDPNGKVSPVESKYFMSMIPRR